MCFANDLRAIAAFLARHTPAHEFDRRLAGDRKRQAPDSRRSKIRAQTLGALRRAARDDERPRTELGRRARKFAHCAFAEADAAGGGEIERHRYQPPSSGKMFAYFTAFRGSAIIGATASRHAW